MSTGFVSGRVLASSLAAHGLLVFLMAVGSTLQAGTPIVFAARPSPRQNAPDVVKWAPSGRLLLLDEKGSIHSLVGFDAPGTPDWTPKDVLDPDVSYDAKRIVFSGYSSTERGWRIYEVGVDGTGLRQITRSDRTTDLSRYGEASPRLEGHNDLDPCYVPDGRICFVSTRYPGIAPDNRFRSTNLFVVDSDGGNLHRITSERFGADTPAVNPQTGQIVYSRWWRSGRISKTVLPAPVPPGSPGYGGGNPSQPQNLAFVGAQVLSGVADETFPGVNSWFLASINPDGTGMAMLSGFHLDRQRTQAYRTRMANPHPRA